MSALSPTITVLSDPLDGKIYDLSLAEETHFSVIDLPHGDVVRSVEACPNLTKISRILFRHLVGYPLTFAIHQHGATSRVFALARKGDAKLSQMQR